jgi:lipoate-protein ligase A
MAQVKESLLLSIEKISGAKPQLTRPTPAELGQMHTLLNDKYSTYNWNRQGTPSAAQI